MPTCDCCPNESDNLHHYKTMMMCDDCFDKEKELEAKSKAEENDRVATIKEVAAAQLSVRDQFWNAAGNDLALITGTPYERAITIKERIDRWQNELFEIKTRESRYHSELMSLVNRLTQEELSKLKINAPSYTPKPVLVKKPKSKERMGKDDRTLLNMANIIFGKKLAQLPVIAGKCGKEHPDWFEPVSRELKVAFRKEYDQFILDNGAMTEQQAIDRMRETVRAGKAKAFDQMASGERSISGELKTGSEK